MKDSELIVQGAEARLYKGIYLGRTCMMKERFVKNYRHSELDARLTKDRIRAEARAIIRAKSAGKNARRIEVHDRKSMDSHSFLSFILVQYIICPVLFLRNSNAGFILSRLGATQNLHGIHRERHSAEKLHR